MGEPLKRYEVDVTEVIHQRKVYVVVARNEGEARRFAETGCTVEERDGKCDGVYNRTVFGVKDVGETTSNNDRSLFEDYAGESGD